MLETKESQNLSESCCQQEGAEVERKLPRWAIAVAVLAFVLFNAFFLVYAMQMSGNNPG